MKYFKLLIFIALFLPYFAFAQGDYEPGYIITNSNDTIKGFVKDRKSYPFGKLYEKIRFKNSSEKRKYSPKQILGYKQGNRVFESLWLEISAALINENYMNEPNVGEKQFLKVDLKGFLTLYQLEIIDPDSDYIDQIPLFKRNGENYLIRVTQGMFGLKKRNLQTYFKNCPELIEKIEYQELKTPLEIALFYNTWIKDNPAN